MRIGETILEELRRHGVVEAKMYLNLSEGAKFEIQLVHLPFTASPENYHFFIDLLMKSYMAYIEALLRNLVGIALYLRDRGLKLDATAWGSWLCRIAWLISVLSRILGVDICPVLCRL